MAEIPSNGDLERLLPKAGANGLLLVVGDLVLPTE